YFLPAIGGIKRKLSRGVRVDWLPTEERPKCGVGQSRPHNAGNGGGASTSASITTATRACAKPRAGDESGGRGLQGRPGRGCRNSAATTTSDANIVAAATHSLE